MNLTPVSSKEICIRDMSQGEVTSNQCYLLTLPYGNQHPAPPTGQ